MHVDLLVARSEFAGVLEALCVHRFRPVLPDGYSDWDADATVDHLASGLTWWGSAFIPLLTVEGRDADPGADSLQVPYGQSRVPVVPMHAVEVSDPALRRVLERLRERLGG